MGNTKFYRLIVLFLVVALFASSNGFAGGVISQETSNGHDGYQENTVTSNPSHLGDSFGNTDSNAPQGSTGVPAVLVPLQMAAQQLK